jgi:radical SAM superfamily enzyme YgiQ (UPF0313 family)
MSSAVFLATPPFTQLNTPYPATAYLKGFLNTLEVKSTQADLGLDLILKLFSKEGLSRIFNAAEKHKTPSENSRRIIALRDEYLQCIEPVIAFLQGKNETMAYRIAEGNFLPQASRKADAEELEWAFGVMGMRDKARHLCTLFLEDLSDLIVDTVDPRFGFSRYAEQLGRSANTFDQLHQELQQNPTCLEEFLFEILHDYFSATNYKLVCFSVPFPGNLFAAFRCAQWLKKHHPNVKIAMGGGFANTELRSLSETRVFSYFDFITLDDGEAPIQLLLDYIDKKISSAELKRTFLLEEGKVMYCNGSKIHDYKQKDVGTPDYDGLRLNEYLSVIELVNPMHKMWSDGRWNKLTMAHGCYWGKCTFCDISLDYIRSYEFASAKIIVDRMQQLLEQTGEPGFHFVDEAAPPSLMREVALEILKRKMSVLWWTNIRFEKSFTRDLCKLLAASGCVAVSGGLEVASDRLLELIDKGVTVAQVARVARNFKEAGIKVHAYLMYGFPTQNDQETIDALEVVRQLFENDIIQSAFWHRFALTAHSPAGMYPEKFGIKILTKTSGTFANNDLEYEDPKGAQHDLYGDGLKTSLFNFMHRLGLENDLQDWFDFKIPKTKHAKNFIAKALAEEEEKEVLPSTRTVWIRQRPLLIEKTAVKKGKTQSNFFLQLHTRNEEILIPCDQATGTWLCTVLKPFQVIKMEEWKLSCEQNGPGNFEDVWNEMTFVYLRMHGLLML